MDGNQPSPVEPTAEMASAADGRDPYCVSRWPDCHAGEYDPRCCRFPKSCSCGPHLPPEVASTPDPTADLLLQQQPVSPAEGEVGGLVADLEVAAASYFNRGFVTDARRCRRAADLLKQQAAELAECREALRRVRLQERIPGGFW